MGSETKYYYKCEMSLVTRESTVHMINIYTILTDMYGSEEKLVEQQ